MKVKRNKKTNDANLKKDIVVDDVKKSDPCSIDFRTIFRSAFYFFIACLNNRLSRWKPLSFYQLEIDRATKKIDSSIGIQTVWLENVPLCDQRGDGYRKGYKVSKNKTELAYSHLISRTLLEDYFSPYIHCVRI